MYYCFVEEDLDNLRNDDPLMIQANYAKRLGVYCCCSLSEKTIVDQQGRPINMDNKRVLLRTTCETMYQAVELLQNRDVELLETLDDIRAVEQWDSLSLSKRRILAVQLENISNASYLSGTEDFLRETPRIFLKSRKKGFCVQISSRKLLQRDAAAMAFFKSRCVCATDELLLSEALDVKADSLGLKESRHFVFCGTIANSSRVLHSVRHAVPHTLLAKATCLAEVISRKNDFPQNYVMDVGEFEKNGEIFVDVIELNPVTSSLCYVNNSVFDKVVPEAEMFHNKTGMGAEYCYDALGHPERYAVKRRSGASYAYTNPEHYSFL